MSTQHNSQTNIETLAQQQSNSRNTVGSTNDRASSPNKINGEVFRPELSLSLIQVNVVEITADTCGHCQ